MPWHRPGKPLGDDMTADVPAPKNLNPIDYHDDDRQISLADIIAVLVQNKWLFLGMWSAVVAAAVIYLLVTPTSYRHFGVLSIGRIPELSDNGAFKLIAVEDPATATARVKDGYIPAVTLAGPENDGRPKVTVTNPRNTSLLVLETYAPDASADMAKALLQEIGDRLVTDHARISNHASGRLKARLDAQNVKLAELQDDELFGLRMQQQRQALANLKRDRQALADTRRLVVRKIADTDRRLKLVEEELGRLERQLADLEASRKGVLNAGSDPTRAMSILLITSQVERIEDRRARLQQEMNISLPQAREKLEKQLRDLDRKAKKLAESIKIAKAKLGALQAERERSIEKQKATIAEAEAMLASVQPTRWVQHPQRDETKRRPRESLITAGAIVGGLIAALFLVFVAQAFRQARPLVQEPSAGKR